MDRAIALAIFAAAYTGLALGRLPGFRVDRTGVAVPPRHPAAGQLWGPYHQDFLLDQRLCLDLRCGGEPADDDELGTVRAQRVHRLRRVARHDAHAYARMRPLERYDDLRQQIRGRDARRRNGERPGHSLAEFTDAASGLREQRMSAEHVIGEELPGGRQLATPGRRTTSFTPVSRSTSAMCFETAGWLICNSFAAAENERRRANAANARRRASRSIIRDYIDRLSYVFQFLGR
jgi:hypothetical protein